MTRDNHYVPRAALRRWSVDGRTVYARRLLVSDERVPPWSRMYIRGLAKYRDLYTVFSGHRESDEFEQWLTTRFEQPGNDAIEKILHGDRLTMDEWHALARYLAAQDLRTPQSFIYLMNHWEKALPEVLDKTIRDATEKYQEAKRKGITLKAKNADDHPLAGLFKIEIVPKSQSDTGQAMVHAETTLGRRMWIADMRHLLMGAAERLCRNQWSIVEPAEGTEWPMTDHPVLKLNYRSPTEYDFGGGWGRPHSELMMPLSPKHLLFAHVGKDNGRRITFSREHTLLVRRFLVERAHRWVFATRPMQWIVDAKKRLADRETFDFEERQWANWHEDQTQAEMSR